MKMTHSRAGQLTHRVLHRPTDHLNTLFVKFNPSYLWWTAHSFSLWNLFYFFHIKYIKLIKTKTGKTTQRSFKKIVPKVFKRRRASFLLSSPFLLQRQKPAAGQLQDIWATCKPLSVIRYLIQVTEGRGKKKIANYRNETGKFECNITQ